jgi:hypothetical protein
MRPPSKTVWTVMIGGGFLFTTGLYPSVMDTEVDALYECNRCHLVYGSEPLECQVCGGTEFTFIRNVQPEEDLTE